MCSVLIEQNYADLKTDLFFKCDLQQFGKEKT